MSICPETTVLRGPIAENAPLAHVNIELRNGRFLIGSKPHLLLNPDLQRAFDEATAAARAAAAAEGFAAGYANGRVQAVAEAELRLAGELAAVREVEAKRAASVESLLAALGRAVAEFESRAFPTYDAVTEQLGSAAYTLVEAILERELVLSHDLALDAVRRVCAFAPRGADLTMWLNPADVAALDGLDLPALVGRPVKLLADPSLGLGDALAESGASRIDARLTSALARVREVLAG
jgi:flagellar assembly protein FliH